MKNGNKKRRKRKIRKILSQITGSLTSLMKTDGIAKIVELLTVAV